MMDFSLSPELAGVAAGHLTAALVFGGVGPRIGPPSTFGTQS
jgi:hypothetical protein